MKNLLHVRDYDEIFKDKISGRRFRRLTKWTHGKSALHKVGDYYPWRYAVQIINKNIGKPFSHAFHLFCQKVPQYMQDEFLQYFRDEHRYVADFIIDDVGNIQSTGEFILTSKYRRKWKTKKIYKAWTKDYKAEMRHKVSGKPMPDHYDSWWFRMYSNKNDKKDDYQLVTVSGAIHEFPHKRFALYQRLTQERMQRERLAYRRQKKARRQKIYCLKTKDELNIIDARKDDMTKIESHGFDPVTSFRNM